LTEKSYLEYVVEKPIGIVENKYELQELLEGHLTFGIFFYRENFPRFSRLFTLLTVLAF